MPTNETILKKLQAGMETVRGTNVAATRKVYARYGASYDKPMMDFQDTTGTFDARRRVAFGREKVGFSMTDIATFEDLPWWLQLAIKGGVVGVTDAGTPPAYTYGFTPSAADDLKSATFEHGEPGNVYESGQGMVNTWTLRGDTDNDSEPGWMFEADVLARDWVPTTYTGSITDRTTEVILARGTKLYIDAAGGTIGTTQVLGKLISWSITGNNQLHFKAFSEDEQNMAANKVGRQARTYDAQLVFEFDADTEFANFRSSVPVQRKVRLEREGSQVHGSTVVNKRLRTDIYGYWSSWSEGDREGNMTCTMNLAGFYDPTAATAITVQVVNALASLA